MSVEVIRCDIQYRRDSRMELTCRLELEAGKLGYDHRFLSGRKSRVRVRVPDITDHEGVITRLLHDLAEQRSRRCLSVRAGDAEHMAFGRLPGKLHLAPDRYSRIP